MNGWAERWLVEQIRTLRYLPPDTQLKEPHDRQEWNLLIGLRDLPEGADPLLWLKESHGNLIARLLLWTALNRTKLLVQGIQRAIRAGQIASSNDYARWLGNLLNLPEDADPFRQLADAHPITTSPELLRDIFYKLRALRAHSGELTGKVSSDEILQLLDHLFQLPEQIDPLQRIWDEYSHLAAVMTLQHIWAQILPLEQLISGQTTKVFRPRLRIHAARPSVMLYEVVFKETGFTITLQVRIPEKLIRIPPAVPGRTIRWEGIEHVIDDIGYHYLVCYRREEGVKRWPWWVDWSLHLFCYPALAPLAQIVTLNSSDTSFVVMGISPGEYRPKALHQIHLGHLTWQVKVAG